MKLRTLTNSIRLRLSQSEVTTIAESGAVSDRVNFPGGNTFVYTLSASNNGLDVALSDGNLSVSVPKSQLDHWTNSLEVGIREEIALADDKVLKILIEKDFACLKPRDGEDESDMFANPDADSAKC